MSAVSVAEDLLALRRDCWAQGSLLYLLHDGCRTRELREYGPTPHGQLAGQSGAWHLYHATKGTFVLEVGRQWGKTVFFCTLALSLLIRTAIERREKKRVRPGRIPYAAPTGKQVGEFIDPTMEWLRDEAKAVGSEWVLEQKNGQWLLPDGSFIVPYGCEDRKKADRLRGPYADAVFVDEAGFIPILGYVVNSVLRFQLATTNGRMALSTSPPESTTHEFVDYATRAAAEGSYFRRTVWDCPFQRTETIRQQVKDYGGEEAAIWRREGLAERLPDPVRAIVPEWDKHRGHVMKEAPRPARFDTYTVADFGFNDMTWVLFAFWDFPRAKIVVEEELWFRHVSSNVVVPAVKKMELRLWAPDLLSDLEAKVLAAPEGERKKLEDTLLRESPWKPHMRFADCDEYTRGDLATVHGFPTGVLHKDELHAQVNALRLAVQAHTVEIHPRCVGTIAQLEGGVWNTQRTNFARQEGMGHFDAVAAMMYLVRHVDKQRNPFPSTRDTVDHQVQWYSPERAPEKARRERTRRRLDGGVVQRLRRKRRWQANTFSR